MQTKVAKTPTTRTRQGGRQKGTPNKSSMTVAEYCEKNGLNVLANLMHFAKGDYEALGYPETVSKQGFGGVTVQEYTITPEQRYKANIDLAKFIYPTRKAVEVKQDPESNQTIVLAYSKESVKDAAKD